MEDHPANRILSRTMTPTANPDAVVLANLTSSSKRDEFMPVINRSRAARVDTPPDADSILTIDDFRLDGAPGFLISDTRVLRESETSVVNRHSKPSDEQGHHHRYGD